MDGSNVLQSYKEEALPRNFLLAITQRQFSLLHKQLTLYHLHPVGMTEAQMCLNDSNRVSSYDHSLPLLPTTSSPPGGSFEWAVSFENTQADWQRVNMKRAEHNMMLSNLFKIAMLTQLIHDIIQLTSNLALFVSDPTPTMQEAQYRCLPDVPGDYSLVRIKKSITLFVVKTILWAQNKEYGEPANTYQSKASTVLLEHAILESLEWILVKTYGDNPEVMALIQLKQSTFLPKFTGNYLSAQRTHSSIPVTPHHTSTTPFLIPEDPRLYTLMEKTCQQAYIEADMATIFTFFSYKLEPSIQRMYDGFQDWCRRHPTSVNCFSDLLFSSPQWAYDTEAMDSLSHIVSFTPHEDSCYRHPEMEDFDSIGEDTHGGVPILIAASNYNKRINHEGLTIRLELITALNSYHVSRHQLYGLMESRVYEILGKAGILYKANINHNDTRTLCFSDLTSCDTEIGYILKSNRHASASSLFDLSPHNSAHSSTRRLTFPFPTPLWHHPHDNIGMSYTRISGQFGQHSTLIYSLFRWMMKPTLSSCNNGKDRNCSQIQPELKKKSSVVVT
jgi:hypothetical protein